MALDPQERTQLDHIAAVCTRLDERTQRMDEEVDRRFVEAHARIGDVKADLADDIKDLRTEARSAGAKAGGILGGLALAGSILKDVFLGH